MPRNRVFTFFLVAISVVVGVVAGGLILPLAGQANGLHRTDGVSGVCMLSRDAVLSQSEVGKVANKRLQRLAQNVKKQIEKENNSLVAAINELRQKSESLTKEEIENRQEKLGQQRQRLQQKANTLNARIRYTRTVVTQRITEVMDPLVNERYKSQSCGVLLNRNGVLRGDEANDLTSDVTAALDDKVAKVNFDLLSLPNRPSDEKRTDSDQN